MKRAWIIFWRKLTGNWWGVRGNGFPYKEGYSTFLPARQMILDTTPSYEEAVKWCAMSNELGEGAGGPLPPRKTK